MKHARVFRPVILNYGHAPSWCVGFTQGRVIEVNYFTTHADALAYALHEVGLTPTNPEEQS